MTGCRSTAGHDRSAMNSTSPHASVCPARCAYAHPVSEADGQRPDLTTGLTGAELARWYWLKSELIGLARMLGVAGSGSKDELTARLVAVLDGHSPPAPSSRATVSPGHQLCGDLSADTVIPPSQRSSQELRAWFLTHVGPSFRFDRRMREFINAADGTTTLGDAVRHWTSTRDEPLTHIDPQFELNRFTRAWHASNPSGTRAELLADWKHYRSLPIDERGRA